MLVFMTIVPMVPSLLESQMKGIIQPNPAHVKRILILAWDISSELGKFTPSLESPFKVDFLTFLVYHFWYVAL